MPGEIGLWQHPKTGRYYITWTVSGRSLRRSTRTRDRDQAETARAAFVLGSGSSEPLDPKDVRIDAVLESYYARHAKHLPSAVQARIAIDSLKDFYGVASVKTISARNHERYIAECREEGLSAASINQRLTRLRAGLRMAQKDGDLVAAPFVPSLTESAPRPEFLDHEQAAALIKGAARWPHVALYIQLALATGARTSAILQLTWDRVDLAARTVDFRLPGVVHARKGRAVTALPTPLVRALRAQQKVAVSANVIEWDGRPIKSIKRSFRLAAAEAKQPHVTPHILKHTAVSWALRVASPWVVSGMTATSVRTLQKVYGKHMVGDLRQAAEAVAVDWNTRKRRAKTKNGTKRKSAVKR